MSKQAERPVVSPVKPTLGFTRARIVHRNCIVRALIDSGNLFHDIISADLAERLNLKIRPTKRRAGTASRQASCDIIGRVKSPVKICLEHIPNAMYIQPYVMRHLSHPLNLSESFLRKMEADMIFRQKHICLKLRNGVTKLIDRQSPIDKPSVDKRFQSVIDNHRANGSNPSMYRKDTLNIPKVRVNTQTPLTRRNSAYKAYTAEKQLLKGRCTHLITLKGNGKYRKTSPVVGTVELEPVYNNKLVNKFLTVHPGMYNRHEDTINVFITNFRTTDQILPDGLFVGYLWDAVSHVEVNEDVEPVSTMCERDPASMTMSEVEKWKSFIIDELKLENNEILVKNPKAKEAIVQAFMANLRAVAKDGHDYGDTNLVQFHLEIEPDARPVRQKVRPLNPIQASDLKRQLDEWTKEGVIEPSRSEWASPLVPVVKKGSSKLRWCVDFRALNNVTKRDNFPLASVETCLSQLSKSKIFSTLDSCGAYHAVTIHPGSRDFTSFIAPQGLFRFKKLPFGLCNAGVCYSRLVDIALNIFKTQEFALGYLDDIICKSPDVESHVGHLTTLLEMHAHFGLKINLSKCEICRYQVKYLGHVVSAEGIKMDPDHVTRILDWSKPTTGKEMKSYLGFCNYYRSFVCEYGELSAPLTAVQNTKGPITWTGEMSRNFDKLKTAFASEPTRGYPDFDEKAAPFIIDTDFSKVCTAGVLSQQQHGREVFLGCTASKNNKAEQSYPSYKGELLSIIKTIKKFEHLLMARRFIIRTDSSALKYLTTMKCTHSLFARWSVYLADFTFVIQHRDGKSHVNADVLSRRGDIEDESQEASPVDEERAFPISYVDERELGVQVEVTNPLEQVKPSHVSKVTQNDENPILVKDISLEEIGSHSQKDYVLKTVIDFVRHQHKPNKSDLEGFSLDVKKYVHLFECLQVKRNVLYLNTPSMNGKKALSRVCLPETLQRKAWQAVHNHGHLGISKTYGELRDRVYWHEMHSYVVMQNRNCVVCITKQASPGKTTHLQHHRRLGCFNQVVFTDTVGPLQPPCTYMNRKCNNILTIQDGYTRFLVAIPIKDLTAATIAEGIVESWIHRFSAPSQIHSDNGPAYVSDLMNHVMKRFGVKRSFSPPYVPEANRIERAHKVINQLLRTDRSKPVENWAAKLSTICFVYNTTVNRMTGLSPLHAMTGIQPRLPVDMIFELYQPKRMSWNKYIDTLRSRYHGIYRQLCQQDDSLIALSNASHKPNWRDNIEEGDQVYYFMNRIKSGITKKLVIRWSGPWLVDKKLSDSLFLISPKGNWCSRPRQVATICSRLRKIDPQVGWSQVNGEISEKVDLPAVLDNYCDLSNDDLITFPVLNDAGPPLRSAPVRMGPIPIPDRLSDARDQNDQSDKAQMDENRDSTVIKVEKDIDLEQDVHGPESSDTIGLDQVDNPSTPLSSSSSKSDGDDGQVEQSTRLKRRRVLPRLVKFRDINYDETNRRGKRKK